MTTLEEAKQFLRDNWEKGTRCPCCNRLVKLQRYPFNSSMGAMLILIYRAYREGRSPVHVEKELRLKDQGNGHEQSQLAKWGMIRAIKNEDPRKKGSGYYEITPAGIEFVTGKSTVPASMKMFNNKVYTWDSKRITIREALKTPFNYEELMNS